MQSISIKICNSIQEAPNWNTNGSGMKGAMIREAIIVRKGMESGNDTVDLIFEDQQGNKYCALITARLLKSVTDLAVTHNKE